MLIVALIFTPFGGVISLGQPDGSDWLPTANDDEPLLSLTLRLPLSLLALPLTTVLPLLSTHLPEPVSVPTLPLHVSPLLSVMTPLAPLLSTLPDAIGLAVAVDALARGTGVAEVGRAAVAVAVVTLDR